MKGKQEITWVHFACDRHEIVFANGCLSESLLLGPMVLNGMNDIEREVLITIFGHSEAPEGALNGPPARDILTVGAAKSQIAQHLKEMGKPVAEEIPICVGDLKMEKYEAKRKRAAAAFARGAGKARRKACIGQVLA